MDSIEAEAAGGEPFAIVIAAMGITNADAAMVRETLDERAATGDLALFLNTADDPLVERILTPRLALTVAEHVAFELGRLNPSDEHALARLEFTLDELEREESGRVRWFQDRQSSRREPAHEHPVRPR